MIELAGVSVKLGGCELLGDFNWHIPDPGVYMLAGETGSGKSLLCDILSGRRKPQGGTVCIDGQQMYRLLGGYSEPIFHARAGETCREPESVESYLSSELRQAGGTPSLLEPVWPELEARLPGGRHALMEHISHGEALLVQTAIVSVAPTRLAILDGHFNYMDEDTCSAAARLLALANQQQERFILLTTSRIPQALPPLQGAFLLYGREPAGIVRLGSDMPLVHILDTHESIQDIHVRINGPVDSRVNANASGLFTILSAEGDELRLRLRHGIPECLAELRRMGMVAGEITLEQEES